MAAYSSTFTIRRLWLILASSMIIMFAVLLYFGREIYQQAPPIPERVETTAGELLYTRADIQRGQGVWQSTGGMQQGSVWGHGGYLAPDWSADWLRREAESLLTLIAAREGADGYNQPEVHEALLRTELRQNTYDPASGVLAISEERAQAVRNVAEHYRGLFQADEAYLDLRRDYAMPLHASLGDEDAHTLGAFFFWTSWSAVTNRPGDDISYTSNWPHDPLVGNTPSASVLLWSLISILLLLGGIGAIVWYYARQYDDWRSDQEPEGGYVKSDNIATATITPSMRATAKFFWVVTALFALQVLLGIVTAHYAVEGQGLYGLPLMDYLPYAVTRTWHTQLAVLWIATAWLATGLYVAPLLSGHEPRFQRFGVNFLFFSLLLIVVGSFAGQWLAVHGHFDSLTLNFWFGHQGYEYIDLGRFWQIYLFIGLLLWVALVLRALWPALKQGTAGSLVFLVVVSMGMCWLTSS